MNYPIPQFFFFRYWLFIDFICFYLERYNELEKHYRDIEFSNNELKQLNTQLEKDLLSVGGVSELFRRGPEVDLNSKFDLLFNIENIFIQGQTSDSSANETGIIKDVLNQSSGSTTSFRESVSHVPPREAPSDEALTAIVISQRERFRIRNIELENVIFFNSTKKNLLMNVFTFFLQENVSLKQQIGIFQNEMDKLRSDNIKLYEKIKFVQTYPVRDTSINIKLFSLYFLFHRQLVATMIRLIVIRVVMMLHQIHLQISLNKY